MTTTEARRAATLEKSMGDARALVTATDSLKVATMADIGRAAQCWVLLSHDYHGLLATWFPVTKVQARKILRRFESTPPFAEWRGQSQLHLRPAAEDD